MPKKEKSQLDLTQELLDATRCRVTDLTKINTLQGSEIERLMERIKDLEGMPVLPYPLGEITDKKAIVGLIPHFFKPQSGDKGEIK